MGTKSQSSSVVERLYRDSSIGAGWRIEWDRVRREHVWTCVELAPKWENSSLLIPADWYGEEEALELLSNDDLDAGAAWCDSGGPVMAERVAAAPVAHLPRVVPVREERMAA